MKIHTDQYLHFQSHHPKHQKLGVVRTLRNRCEMLVSEECEKQKEIKHLEGALSQCGYPPWALKKVEESEKNKKVRKKKEKSEKQLSGATVCRRSYRKDRPGDEETRHSDSNETSYHIKEGFFHLAFHSAIYMTLVLFK